MPDLSMEDIKIKLESDSDGTYKKWLINKLQDYKIQNGYLKQGLLQPDIYEKLNALDSALDAALTVISQYHYSKIKPTENSNKFTLSSLFYL